MTQPQAKSRKAIGGHIAIILAQFKLLLLAVYASVLELVKQYYPEMRKMADKILSAVFGPKSLEKIRPVIETVSSYTPVAMQRASEALQQAKKVAQTYEAPLKDAARTVLGASVKVSHSVLGAERTGLITKKLKVLAPVQVTSLISFLYA